MRLSSNNFRPTLQHRWNLLTPRDLTNAGAFHFEAFLYVKHKSKTQQFYRATAARVHHARVRRATYEAANAMSFGPITAHHLDIVNAWRPESAAFEVPTDNTTQQAMYLDQQIRTREREEHVNEELRAVTVTIKLNGLWLPIVVDARSLRRAVGLPEHGIFLDGIFHAFQPTVPTNAATEDVDHQATDDDEMVDG